jgi:hypothetical protein
LVIVPALVDGWWWVWSSRWNDRQGKLKYSEKTYPSATLFTINPTLLEPATNCLSYSTSYRQVPSEHEYLTTKLHEVMSNGTVVVVFTAVTTAAAWSWGCSNRVAFSLMWHYVSVFLG